jgi:hypothetical protein
VNLAIDHLVVAARSLEEGSAWIASRLGVAPAGGGRHDYMGTHNRLLGLGPETYLEVIAIDPAATKPARPRWFELDHKTMEERLERGPALIHWVARVDDIAAAAPAAPVDLGDIVAAARGDYRWHVTVTRDGSLPAGGVFPTLIEWHTRRPATSLPDAGFRLESLDLAHPRAAAIDAALRSMGLAGDAPIAITEGEPKLAVRIRARAGVIELA